MKRARDADGGAVGSGGEDEIPGPPLRHLCLPTACEEEGEGPEVLAGRRVWSNVVGFVFCF